MQLATKIRKKKRRKIFFKLVLIFFICVIVFKLVMIQINISKKQRELNELNQKVSYQTEQNDILKQQINSGITDEYIEKVAREKLNLVSPFERIFVDVTRE